MAGIGATEEEVQEPDLRKNSTLEAGQKEQEVAQTPRDQCGTI